MATPYWRRIHTEAVSSFRQFDGETLFEANRRMRDMLEDDCGHYLSDLEVLEIFYNGLDFTSQNILNSFSQNHFLNLNADQAFQILNDLINWDEKTNVYSPSNFTQNEFWPENSNFSQANFCSEKFEKSSNHWCENYDQFQNESYYENHDFPPTNFGTWNQDQPSNFSQNNFNNTISKIENNMMEMKNAFRNFCEKWEQRLQNDDQTDQLNDSPVSKPRNSMSNYWYDSDSDEVMVRIPIRFGIKKETEDITDPVLTEPEAIKDNAELEQYKDMTADNDHVVVCSNYGFEEKESILVPEPVEDDFTDDEMAEEKGMFEQEPVKDHEDFNLLQPVDGESVDDEFEEEKVELLPEPVETTFEVNDNTFDEQLQELLGCDLGKTEDNKNGDITTKEFEEILEMNIDEFEQWLEEPSTEAESETTVKIPIESTGRTFPLTVFTGAEVITKM